MFLAKKHNIKELQEIISTEELIKLLNMGYFDLNHPQKNITIGENNFSVDEKLYNLMLKMWNNGIYTKFSCQGCENNPAYISFDSVKSAKRFFIHCPIAKTNVTMDLIRDDTLIKIDINNLDIINDGLISIRFNPELIPLFESSYQ